MGWLLDRAERNGFRVCDGADGSPQLKVSQRNKSSFMHAGTKATLSTAVFDGVLEVVDEELLRQALCCGIGRAKAFGCGLMTIAPLP